MRKYILLSIAIILGLLLACALPAQETRRDTVRYVPKYRDPVLKEMRERALAADT